VIGQFCLPVGNVSKELSPPGRVVFAPQHEELLCYSPAHELTIFLSFATLWHFVRSIYDSVVVSKQTHCPVRVFVNLRCSSSRAGNR
jgi:hypothetical protein